MFQPILRNKRIPRRKLSQEILSGFEQILELEAESFTSLFTFEMTRHPELAQAWKEEMLPQILDAADQRSRDEQKRGLRELLKRLVRERETAMQFLFEYDTPQDWPEHLRDDDEREVLIKHIYQPVYRLGGVDEYARIWGRMAIMDDATIYMARYLAADLFDDAGKDDWFFYYLDAVSRMVFHRHEAALAAERDRPYEAERLVRAYEQLLDNAESEIRDLQGFSYSRLEFERSVLEKKGRKISLLDDPSQRGGRPSVYIGEN